MDAAQITSLIVGLGSLLGVILAYFKFKPGQRQQIDMHTAQANMNVAQGTFQMVTTELEEQFKRMSDSMNTMRVELDDVHGEVIRLRGQLADTKHRLTVITEERDSLRQQNVELKGRVKALEDQVRSLTAGGTIGA